MADSGSELEPIIGGRQSRNFRCNSICTYLSHVKWRVFLLMLLFQLVGIILFTIWAVDCFFREFRTTSNCEHFDRFPKPRLFQFFWLLSSFVNSVFLIYDVVCRSPAFCGTRTVIRHLFKKNYFYKISLKLLLVVVYDILVITNNPGIWKTVCYVFFIMEEFITVVVMFLLNFLPRFWNVGESSLKYWLYKAALAMYVLQNYLVSLFGSTMVAYEVLNMPVLGPKINDEKKHGAKSVVGLMFLVISNEFRYSVADFFFSKIFDEKVNILGGELIEKSIDHTMITTTTQGFEEIQS